VQAHFEPRPDTCLLRLSTLPQDVDVALEAILTAPAALQSFVGQVGVGVCVAHLRAMSSHAWAAVVQHVRTNNVQCSALYPAIDSGFGDAADESALDRLVRRTRDAFDPERRFAGRS
jgi:hypothetical protein